MNGAHLISRKKGWRFSKIVVSALPVTHCSRDEHQFDWRSFYHYANQNHIMLMQMKRPSCILRLLIKSRHYTRPYDVVRLSSTIMYLKLIAFWKGKIAIINLETLTQGGIYNLKAIYNKHFSRQANITVSEHINTQLQCALSTIHGSFSRCCRQDKIRFKHCSPWGFGSSLLSRW